VKEKKVDTNHKIATTTVVTPQNTQRGTMASMNFPTISNILKTLRKVIPDDDVRPDTSSTKDSDMGEQFATRKPAQDNRSAQSPWGFSMETEW
jgi:hypothetical protein